jgi:hypothetical protein
MCGSSVKQHLGGSQGYIEINVASLRRWHGMIFIGRRVHPSISRKIVNIGLASSGPMEAPAVGGPIGIGRS